MKKITGYIIGFILLSASIVQAADIKVSALPAATSAGSADLLLLTQGGASKKITVTNFLALPDAVNTSYATVASNATTSAIWAAAGNIINFTGNETITAFPAAPQAGAQRWLICAGTPTFTHAGALTVQGGVSYTAAAGDVILVTATTTTAFKITILKQSGLPTVLQTTVTGNAGTATALAANGANCSSGSAPLGVDASGAAEGCFAVQADIGLTAKSDSTSTTSSTTAASSTAVKAAYDHADTKIPFTSGLASALPGSCTPPSRYYATDTNVNYECVTATFYPVKTWPATISKIIWNDGSGNPVTTGISQTANYVYAGPATGAAAAPTFRALVAATLNQTTTGAAGSLSNAATSGGPFILGLDNANPAKAKELTLDAHLSLTGTTAPALAIVTPTIDGHAAVTLTAAQMSGNGCIVTNYGQAAADVRVTLPAAAAGLSALFTVATAQANHWGALAGAGDKFYLIAADGTVTAGTDADAVVMVAAQLGQAFAVWSFQSGNGTWDWMAKAISIGTSTFGAHAAF